MVVCTRIRACTFMPRGIRAYSATVAAEFEAGVSVAGKTSKLHSCECPHNNRPSGVRS